MRGVRGWCGALLLVAARASAQTVPLIEPAQVGDCTELRITLQYAGEIVVQDNGTERKLPQTATATHLFRERVLAVEGGIASKVARVYSSVNATVATDGQPSQRTLRAERALVVAQRVNGQLTAYSPRGSLSRSESELVGEQFDTLALVGLLPQKEVAVGDTWKVPPQTVQALALFEGLRDSESEGLTGKLTGVTAGIAAFSISGTVKGIDKGAQATIEISAEGTFDLLKKRLTKLTWKQKDDRAAGTVSPMATGEATVTLQRTGLDVAPELGAAGLASVPTGFELPAGVGQVVDADPAGQFRLSHSRDWHLTGSTPSHTVLRLLDRGDWIAQATVSPWAKAKAGDHISAEDFRNQMMQSPGWQPQQVIDEGEVSNQPAGRWVYRVTISGEMENAKVVQTHYLIAGPSGQQMVIAFTMQQGKAAKLGARDVAFVDGVELTGK